MQKIQTMLALLLMITLAAGTEIDRIQHITGPQSLTTLNFINSSSSQKYTFEFLEPLSVTQKPIKVTTQLKKPYETTCSRPEEKLVNGSYVLLSEDYTCLKYEIINLTCTETKEMDIEWNTLGHITKKTKKNESTPKDEKITINKGFEILKKATTKNYNCDQITLQEGWNIIEQTSKYSTYDTEAKWDGKDKDTWLSGADQRISFNLTFDYNGDWVEWFPKVGSENLSCTQIANTSGDTLYSYPMPNYDESGVTILFEWDSSFGSELYRYTYSSCSLPAYNDSINNITDMNSECDYYDFEDTGLLNRCFGNVEGDLSTDWSHDPGIGGHSWKQVLSDDNKDITYNLTSINHTGMLVFARMNDASLDDFGLYITNSQNAILTIDWSSSAIDNEWVSWLDGYGPTSTNVPLQFVDTMISMYLNGTHNEWAFMTEVNGTWFSLNNSATTECGAANCAKTQWFGDVGNGDGTSYIDTAIYMNHYQGWANATIGNSETATPPNVTSYDGDYNATKNSKIYLNVTADEALSSDSTFWINGSELNCTASGTLLNCTHIIESLSDANYTNLTVQLCDSENICQNVTTGNWIEVDTTTPKVSSYDGDYNATKNSKIYLNVTADKALSSDSTFWINGSELNCTASGTLLNCTHIIESLSDANYTNLTVQLCDSISNCENISTGNWVEVNTDVKLTAIGGDINITTTICSGRSIWAKFDDNQSEMTLILDDGTTNNTYPMTCDNTSTSNCSYFGNFYNHTGLIGNATIWFRNSTGGNFNTSSWINIPAYVPYASMIPDSNTTLCQGNYTIDGHIFAASSMATIDFNGAKIVCKHHLKTALMSNVATNPSVIMRDGTVTNCSQLITTRDGGYGLRSVNITNMTIINITNPIFFSAQMNYPLEVHVINSTVSGSKEYDVNLKTSGGYANIYFTNTTVNNYTAGTPVIAGNGTLYKRNYFDTDVYIENGTRVEANVSLYITNKSFLFSKISNTSGEMGYTIVDEWQHVISYFEVPGGGTDTINETTNQTPHLIFAKNETTWAHEDLFIFSENDVNHEINLTQAAIVFPTPANNTEINLSTPWKISLENTTWKGDYAYMQVYVDSGNQTNITMEKLDNQTFYINYSWPIRYNNTYVNLSSWINTTYVGEWVETPTRQYYLNLLLYDTTPPEIFNEFPPAGGPNYGVGTTTVPISFNTNEEADCRYSLTDVNYSLMSNLTTTGEEYHAENLTGLSAGETIIYLRCNDNNNNTNNVSSTINFTIDSAAPSSGGGGSGDEKYDLINFTIQPPNTENSKSDPISPGKTFNTFNLLQGLVEIQNTGQIPFTHTAELVCIDEWDNCQVLKDNCIIYRNVINIAGDEERIEASKVISEISPGSKSNRQRYDLECSFPEDAAIEDNRFYQAQVTITATAETANTVTKSKDLILYSFQSNDVVTVPFVILGDFWKEIFSEVDVFGQKVHLIFLVIFFLSIGLVISVRFNIIIAFILAFAILNLFMVWVIIEFNIALGWIGATIIDLTLIAIFYVRQQSIKTMKIEDELYISSM